MVFNATFNNIAVIVLDLEFMYIKIQIIHVEKLD